MDGFPRCRPRWTHRLLTESLKARRETAGSFFWPPSIRFLGVGTAWTPSQLPTQTVVRRVQTARTQAGDSPLYPVCRG